jgi:glycosyltransferase involved in cell wall biosynthesis
MRIGFLCYDYPPNPWPGGVSVFVRTLSQQLARRGHVPVVISHESSLPSSRFTELVDGIKVHRLRRSRTRPRAVWQRLQIQRAIESVARRERLDLLESYEDQGIVLRRVPGCPLVVRFHTSDTVRRKMKGLPSSLIGEFLERRLLMVADERVGVSEWLARTTMELLRLPGLSCRVIYNGVDAELFAPASAETRIRGLVLFAGALIERKGLPTLLRAIPDVVRRFPEVRLRCVGADPEQPGFPSDLSRQYLAHVPADIRSHVEFAGPVPHMQMPAEYQRAELCVLPSILEGHPLAVLEAMACGTPVVFSRDSVGPEVITDGEDGFLCDVRNPKALADTICHALEHCRADSGIRARARKKVEEEFSLDRATAANVELYESLVKGPRRN